MHKYIGGCRCENITFQVSLTSSVNTYSPRVCDCDFCKAHDASYLSDPKGALKILIKDDAAISTIKQGSNLASFMLCKRCDVLIAAYYKQNTIIYAAINSKTLHDAGSLAQASIVSPKLLSADEKVARWLAAWFSNVSIESKY